MVHGVGDLAILARLDDPLHDDRMRLITDAENVCRVDEAAAGVRGLEVVDGLPHVAFSGEDEGGDAVWVVLNLRGV